MSRLNGDPSARPSRLALAIGAAVVAALGAVILGRALVDPPEDRASTAVTELRGNLETALSNPNLDPTVRAGLEGKLRSLTEEDRIRAVGRQGAANKSADPGPPPSQPTATPFSGLWEVRNPPYPGWYALPTNAWSGQTAAGRVTVYAGYLTDDPDQSIVTVMLHPGEASGYGQQLETRLPRATGKVVIESSDGVSVVLRAEDASVWELSLQTRIISEVAH